MTHTKQSIIDLGGKEWIKGDLKRVYITCDIYNVLREQKNLPAVNFSDKSNKFFFDVKDSAVKRSYKGKPPTIEIQY